METVNNIYWKKAIELIKQGEKPDQSAIDFNNETIHWTYVQEFNQYGYRVPQELIDYDDESIDFSDIPELNEENIKNGTYRSILPVSCDYEIIQWIKANNIDYNTLINDFLRSVYHTIGRPDNNSDNNTA